MRYSKFAKRIRLIIAGRGPIEKTLKQKADALYRKGIISYPVEFGFHDPDELEAIYRKSDLYIHCATIEVEGLSCMEAIELGLVPIIATGKYTATSQFAFSDRSRYKARNARDLASKIDWWLEHDEKRRSEARKYLGMGKKYDIHKSIDKLIQMYEDVLNQRCGS
jgi:glycosyltransferase involved in cell wall biosynthesis